MKCSPAQLERSLKKLARAMAEANCSNPSKTDHDHMNDLWRVFETAWLLLRKTGSNAEYHKEMLRIHRHLEKERKA